jgi:hypothetical protein
MWKRVLPLVICVACAPRLYTQGDTDTTWSWETPENDWPRNAPPEGTTGQGFGVGQTVPDLRLMDQHGNEVSTWQFYGRHMILDISTMWCAPCQELAAGTQPTQEYFGWDQLAYVTVLQENIESQPPEPEDLELWAENFGIESPILADGDKLTSPAIQNGQFPALLIIGPDLVVRQRVNPPNDPTLHAAVEQQLE